MSKSRRSKPATQLLNVVRNRSTRPSNREAVKPGDLFVYQSAFGDQTVAGPTPVSLNTNILRMGKSGTYATKLGTRTVINFTSLPEKVVVLEAHPDSTNTFRIVRRNGSVERTWRNQA